MIYICGDIISKDDKFACHEEGVVYNQCCQECSNVDECTHHCDYAHKYNCLVKSEVEDDEE